MDARADSLLPSCTWSGLGLLPWDLRECVEPSVKSHRSGLRALLLAAAISCGAAHAEAPDEAREEVTFRPWIGALGVHFPSESLFEALPLPGARGATGGPGGLSGQASAAGLQGLGLGGDWRPFQNGFRLSFAMYLDPNQPGGSEDGSRPRSLFEGGSVSEDPFPLTGELEAVPYVGLGWKTNDGGLGVNLDVGAFLPGESPLRAGACLDPDSPLTGCETGPFGDGRGKLTGSFRKFEWYPVVSLGIEYRF